MSISELEPLKSSGTEPAPSGGDSGDSLVGGDKPLSLSPDAVPEFVLEDDGSVPSWSRATFRFQQRLSAGSEHVARFTTPWARKTRGKLLSADETAREWAQMTTALLTFTGSPFLGEREPMPPVSFLDALRQPARARRRRLRRMLDETADRWLTIRVIGASQTSYPHSHVAVYADTRLSESDFEPVVQAHLDGCPVAQQEAHGHGTVVVEHEPRESNPTGVVNYLNQNVPGLKSLYNDGDGGSTRPESGGILQESTARQRTATLLEATGTDAYSISTSDGVEWDT